MTIIRYEQGKLPKLTKEQKAELAVLAQMDDSDIDTSDIPPLSEVQWANAVRGRFYKPIKMPTTVRVDADVLAWLKSQGKGYQTRINDILRTTMLESLSHR
jgi:uncharacterized protein (DUF4415 family)